MPRARDPNRDRAFEIWREHKGKITNRQIAEILKIDEKKVAVWKQRDGWNVVQQFDPNVVQQKKKTKNGAPPRNKNAVGNRGGAAPKGNSNAVTHGFFRKFFPDESAEIMEQLQIRSPLDMLWDNITIQYTAIIRAQQIMYVRDQEDSTTTKIEEKGGESSWGEKWEVQHAWDKQASFLAAQSRAMATLQGMIRQYESMCRQSDADEEQRLRIEKLKLEIKGLRGPEDQELPDDGFLDALKGNVSEVWADGDKA